MNKFIKSIITYLMITCILFSYIPTTLAISKPIKEKSEYELEWIGLSENANLNLTKTNTLSSSDKIILDEFNIKLTSGKILDNDAGVVITIKDYVLSDLGNPENIKLYNNWKEIPYIYSEDNISFITKELGTFVFAEEINTNTRDITINDSDTDISIDTLRVIMRRGAIKINGDYVWTATNSYANHAFVYRIIYAISGTYDYSPGQIIFTMPASILINRSGNLSDYYELSIPREDSENLNENHIFVYKEDIDSITGEKIIVVYNRISCPAAQNGYFEISFNTLERTYEYADYDPNNIGVDNNPNNKNSSNPFYANMIINQDSTSKTATTDRISVYIDTEAKVTSTDKRVPRQMYNSWQSSWGTAPSDADDYYYLIWEVRTIIKDTTQPYNFSLVDSFTITDGEVAGYKMQGQSQFISPNNGGGIVYNLKENYLYGRYDYVLTRHLKSTYDTIANDNGRYTISNLVTAVVDPVDQVDDDSQAISRRDFTYIKPSFLHPNGHFYMEKWGLDYKNIKVEDSEYIRSFNLSEYYEGHSDILSDLAFYSYFHGYPYPWTIPADADPEDPSNYGINPVTYIFEDNTLYLASIIGEKTQQLEYDEYYIESISLYWIINDAIYNPNTLEFEAIPAIIPNDEYISIYAEIEGDCVLVGYFYLASETFVPTTEGTDLGITYNNRTIYFNNTNCNGFKWTSTNSHYYFYMRTIPRVTLTRSNKLDNVCDEAFECGQNKIILYNDAKATVYKGSIIDESNKIVQFNDEGMDFIVGIIREGNLEKEIIGYSNDVLNEMYTVTWSIIANESYLIEDGARNYIKQESGKFYDLLPIGSIYIPSSLNVYADDVLLDSNEYNVSIIENYQNTGRTMIIVECIIEADGYRVIYSTNHTWDAIGEYGSDLLNSVAYETGNDDIGGGLPDNGGDITEAALFIDLDTTTDNNKFIYCETSHLIGALTSGSLGLYKQVSSIIDDKYSYSTMVYSDQDYSYRLRFATDDVTQAKDLILIDSIENYTIAAGDLAGHGSDWHGEFRGLDVRVPETLGIDPIIWYSLYALDISSLNINENYAFEDHLDIWVNASTYSGSLSAVKTFAVDMRKDTENHEYILPTDTPISVVVYMHSPNSITSLVDDPVTYNNIYLFNSVASIDQYEEEISWITGLNHQDYTKVRYRTVGDLNILKVDSTNTDIPVSGISFRLWGTSFYGTEVDSVLTTNSRGYISFENIERGTYSLQEIDGVADYQQDHILMTVTVDRFGNAYIGVPIEENGNITYDYSVYGNLVLGYDNNTYIIGNEPRIHGDFTFIKKVSIDKSENVRILPNVTFKISGISNYGNDILMYVTSDSFGKVTITNLEFGTYEMIEVEVPNNVILSKEKYSLYCDSNGIISISHNGNVIEQNINGEYVVMNEPKHMFQLRKYDPVTNESLEGAAFELAGVSDYNTSVHQVISSDANGMVIFSDLEPGNYILKEIQAPAHHELDSTVRLVHVSTNGNVTIDFEYDDEYNWFLVPNNRLYEGTLEITKVWTDAENSEHPIPVIHIDNSEPTYDLPVVTIDKTKWTNAWNSTSRKTAVVEFRNYNNYSDPQYDTVVRVDDMTTDYRLDLLFNSQDRTIVYWKTDAAVVYYPVNASSMFDGWTLVTSLDITNWNTSKVNNMDSMFSNCRALLSLDLGNFDTSNVTTMSYMFYYCAALTSLDLSSFNTANCTKMNAMFYLCIALTYLDVSSFDTSNVTTMTDMFNCCRAIETLNLSNFDTHSVKTMMAMFSECGKLSSLNISSFNTSNVNNMQKMFYKCASLTSLDLSHFDTHNVTTFATIFYMDTGLLTLDVSTFDTSACTNMSYMFETCSSLTSLDVSSFDTSKVTNMSYMFDGCASLTSLDITNFDTSNVTSMQFMFYNCKALTSIDLSNFDTSSATNLTALFGWCISLLSIDTSNFDTRNVTVMSRMFDNCKVVTQIDVSSLNTSNVTKMDQMFRNCNSLQSIDVSNFNTSNVTTLSYMFYSCNSLITLDLHNFDTSNVTTFDSMFTYCQKLKSINLAGWNTSNATVMSLMFSSCNQLLSLDVSSFDTSNVTTMTNMFGYCQSMTTLDISNFNTSAVTTTNNMFIQCYQMTTIYVSEWWDMSNVTASTNMFKDAGRLPNYDANVIDKTNAHYDVGGYLTYKQAPTKSFEIVEQPKIEKPIDKLEPVIPKNISILEDTNIEIDYPSLTSNSEMYIGNEPADVYNLWIDNGNGTWTYRFNVYDGQATYYIWESAMPGYSSNMDINNPLVVVYNEGGILSTIPENDPRLVITTNETGTHYRIVVTNTPIEDSSSSIRITKLVTGTSATSSDLNNQFNFKVTLYTDSSCIHRASTTGIYGDMMFLNGVAEFTLSHNHSMTAVNLPENLYYAVEELDADNNGFVTTSTNAFGLLDNTLKEITFVNAKPDLPPDEAVGGFTLTKYVVREDNEALTQFDRDKEFMFTIELDQPLSGIYGDVVFINGIARVALKHNETAIISNLPENIQYIVTEDAELGYTSNCSNNIHTIVENEVENILVTNTKLATPVNGFTLRKIVNGTTTSNTFRFHIMLSELESTTTYTYVYNNETITFTSDNNGEAYLSVALRNNEEAVFNDLPVGTIYSVVENPSGYIASYEILDSNQRNHITLSFDENSMINQALSTKQEIVEEDENIIITFTNTSSTYDLNICKFDINNELLYGATLQIVDLINNRIVKEWISSGSIDTVQLAEGSYALVETRAPDGYLIADPINFTVDELGLAYINNILVTNITMIDHETKVYIEKVDESGNQVSNAKLQILDEEDNVVYSWITNGTLELSGILSTSTPYHIHEVITPFGYHALEEDIEFILDENGNLFIDNTQIADLVISVINNKKTSTMSISKTVTGNMGNKSEKFTFRINVDLANGIYFGDINGENVSITFVDGYADVLLSHGETLTIIDLPYNSSYTITEINAPSYQATFTNNQGTLLDDPVNITCINNRAVTISTGVKSTIALGIVLIGVTSTLLIIRRKKYN